MNLHVFKGHLTISDQMDNGSWSNGHSAAFMLVECHPSGLDTSDSLVHIVIQLLYPLLQQLNPWL